MPITIANTKSDFMHSATYQHWAYITSQAKRAQTTVPPVPQKSAPETATLTNRVSSSNQDQYHVPIHLGQQPIQVIANLLGSKPVSTQDFLTHSQQITSLSQSNTTLAAIGQAQIHNGVLTSLAYAYNANPVSVGNTLNRLV